MNSVYLGGFYRMPKEEVQKSFRRGIRYFAIGVKGQSMYDIDAIIVEHPYISIVRRLPEVTNTNYLQYIRDGIPNIHILQPVILTWKDQ